jgi:hypothetical protein
MEGRAYGADHDCDNTDLERGEFKAERIREDVQRRFGCRIDAFNESVIDEIDTEFCAARTHRSTAC